MQRIKGVLEKYKEIINGLIMIILLILGCPSMVYPLNINDKLVRVEKIILGISSFFGIWFLILFIGELSKRKAKGKKIVLDIMFVLPLCILEVASILMCLSSELGAVGNWIIAIASILLLAVEIVLAVKILFGKFLQQEKFPIILTAFLFLMLMFAVTNDGLGDNKLAKLFYIFSGMILYLLAFAVYTYKCLYGKKYSGISKILLMVLFGGSIVITFPFFVQWCGLNGEEFESFLTVYASALGGGITLAGVAWTIKDSNQKHQAELWRIEEERRQDERKLYRPFLNYYADTYQGFKKDIWVYTWMDETDKISKVKTKKLLVPNYISSCYFKNTDFSHFYVWGIKLNDSNIHFKTIRFIRKDDAFGLHFSKNPIFTEKPVERMAVILEDMLTNLYELPLKIEFVKEGKTYRIVGSEPTILSNIKITNEVEY